MGIYVYRLELSQGRMRQVCDLNRKDNIFDRFFVVITLLNPSMWMRPKDFVNGLILPLSPKWKVKYPFKGAPNEYASDMCISHLLESILTQDECEILSMCEAYYFSPNTRVHGYPLTHRLLFWQVFTAINCSDYYDVSSIKVDLCTRIMSEAKGIVNTKNFTYNLLRDLFLEQGNY